MQKKSVFSEWQLTVLVIIAGMGGMYFYPESFGRWSGLSLSVAIAGSLLVMAMLARCFMHSSSKSFPGMLRESLGYIPAKLILAAAAIYFAAEICRITVKQTQMTGLFLLEKTPPQVIPAVTLLMGPMSVGVQREPGKPLEKLPAMQRPTSLAAV